MELLGDILSYHQSFSVDLPHSSQVHHRMAYTGTAIFTIKLLQTILPPEKVCMCACATKSINTFFMVFCDYFTLTLKIVEN